MAQVAQHCMVLLKPILWPLSSQSAQFSIQGSSSGPGDLKKFLALPWGAAVESWDTIASTAASHVVPELLFSPLGREGFSEHAHQAH